MSGSTHQRVELDSAGIVGRRSRLGRWFKYALWLALASAIPPAADRLLIAPHVNATLGAEVYGAFLFVQAFFFIAGNIVANGISLVVLRDYASQPRDAAPRMFRTAMSLAAASSLVVLPATVLLALRTAPPDVRAQAAPLFACLPLVAAFRSLDLMLVNMLRIHRFFGRIVLLKVLEAGMLLVCLRTFSELHLWFVAGVYLLCAATSFAVNVSFHWSLLSGSGWWDHRYVKPVLCGSLAGTMMTLFDQTQVHLPKLVLGLIINDLRMVTVFFAATSIGSLFVMPVSLIGTCLLSLFAGHREFVLRGGRFVVFLACGFVAAGTVFCGAYFLGPWIVQRLFPDLGDQVATFFGWIALAGGGTSLVMLVRPIIVKYGRLVTATKLSAVTVILQVGSLPFAAANFGVKGAAVVTALAALANASLWLTAAFLISCRANREFAQSVESKSLTNELSRNDMIVFVQRVFSDYRVPFFRACGQAIGGVKVVHHRNRHLSKVVEANASDITSVTFNNWLPPSLERRGLFFNPRLAFAVARERSALVVVEGESNLLNNLLLVPLLLWRRQPYVWFTLGRPTTPAMTWRRRLLWPVAKWMMCRAETIACYSTAGKDYLTQQGLATTKIVVLNNALDPGAVLATEEASRELASRWIAERGWSDRLRVTYVGALAADKRPTLLVEAAAEYRHQTGKPLGVIFVGDGAELEKCRQRARELKVDAVFTGRKSASEASTFILAADAVVLPGLGGLAINHAMMLGRPVICGRADGTEQDLVIDGETGFYLEPLDETSLANILVLLARDPTRAKHLGRRAREHVNETATVEKMVERLMGNGAKQPTGHRSPQAA